MIHLILIIIGLLFLSTQLYKWTKEDYLLLPAYTITHPTIELKEPKDTKVIWSFWHDEDWSPLIRCCIKSWMKHNPGYIINMMSMQTFSRFVDVKELPKMFDTLGMQHKADVIRLSVLKKYGGYWLDATLFLNEPLSNRWEPMNYDVGGYNADHFQSQFSDKIVFENWFIAAPKGSPLISDWFDEYVGSFDKFTQSSYNENRSEYTSDLIRRGVDLQRLGIIRSGYFSMHCAFLAITMKHHNKYKIKYLDDQMRRKIIDNKDNISPLSFNADGMLPFFPCTSCFKSMLTTTKYSYLPMIKFNGSDRKQVEEMWYLLKKDSTLGAIALS